MSILTGTGFDYEVSARKDGTVEIRIGAIVAMPGHEPIVVRMAFSDALCFGVDVANAARWALHDNAVRRQLGTEEADHAG